MKGGGNKVWKKDFRCLFILKNDDGGVRKRCGLLFQNENLTRTKVKRDTRLKGKEKRVQLPKAKSGKQLRIDTTPVNTGVRVIDSSSESFHRKNLPNKML